jgi:hypothetical protein
VQQDAAIRFTQELNFQTLLKMESAIQYCITPIYSTKFVVRVGGGYLSIDEFLDQYTPVELEKL